MKENRFNSFERYLSANQQSRWASVEEIKAESSFVNLNEKTISTAGLPLVSDGENAWVDGKDNHTLIYGSTGSQKTRIFVMPTICTMIKAGESFVVTDPKGELYDRTAGLAEKNGYDIKVLDFREIGKGEKWNPLAYPYEIYIDGQTDKATMLVNDFIEVLATRAEKSTASDPFWTNSAKSFALASILLLFEAAVYKSEVNVASFASLCNGSDENIEKLLYLVNRMDETSVCAINYNGVLNCAENTLKSIMVVLHSMISVFVSQKDLVSMLSCSTFDIKDIGSKKTALYLIVPDEKTTTHFLVTAFIKQAYEILIEHAYHQKGSKLPVRTNFVLDEFCNIPQIPDMPNMIAAARSRNIRYFLVVQSTHQLKSRYGDDAETIKGNCLNIVFLTSKELALLKEMSNLCGEIVLPNGNIRPLISTSELQHFDKKSGEALIIHDRCYPIITEFPDIDHYTAFPRIAPPPKKSNDLRMPKIRSAKRIVEENEYFGIPFGRKDILKTY